MYYWYKLNYSLGILYVELALSIAQLKIDQESKSAHDIPALLQVFLCKIEMHNRFFKKGITCISDYNKLSTCNN